MSELTTGATPQLKEVLGAVKQAGAEARLSRPSIAERLRMKERVGAAKEKAASVWGAVKEGSGRLKDVVSTGADVARGALTQQGREVLGSYASGRMQEAAYSLGEKVGQISRAAGEKRMEATNFVTSNLDRLGGAVHDRVLQPSLDGARAAGVMAVKGAEAGLLFGASTAVSAGRVIEGGARFARRTVQSGAEMGVDAARATAGAVATGAESASQFAVDSARTVAAGVTAGTERVAQFSVDTLDATGKVVAETVTRGRELAVDAMERARDWGGRVEASFRSQARSASEAMSARADVMRQAIIDARNSARESAKQVRDNAKAKMKDARERHNVNLIASRMERTAARLEVRAALKELPYKVIERSLQLAQAGRNDAFDKRVEALVLKQGAAELRLSLGTRIENSNDLATGD